MEQSLRVIAAETVGDTALDELVERSSSGTFLHTRRYLGYHGDRFRDVSLAICTEEGSLLGFFPAAIDPADENRVVSHPGLSYGGVVHAGQLRGERMIAALKAISSHYSGQGFRSLRYKSVPYIYDTLPAGDDRYALFRLGARRYRCDLLSTIDLTNRPLPSERRRRSLKKALKAGVEVREGAEFLAPLWSVLEENLQRKHGASPVHSREEIAQLHALFPDQIRFAAVVVEGEVQAGVVLFDTPCVVHAQYIASSAIGYDVAALDAVFDHCISAAIGGGARYFDFGSSNEEEGRYLNEGLFRFKSEFGAGSVPHEFYEMDLT